jgi:hypothetical protein
MGRWKSINRRGPAAQALAIAFLSSPALLAAAPAMAQEDARNFCNQIQNANADQVKASVEKSLLLQKEAKAAADDLATQTDAAKKKLDAAKAALISIASGQINAASGVLAELRSAESQAKQEQDAIVSQKLSQQNIDAAQEKYLNATMARLDQEGFVKALGQVNAGSLVGNFQEVTGFSAQARQIGYTEKYNLYQAALAEWGRLAVRNDTAQAKAKSIEAARPAIKDCVDKRVDALQQAALQHEAAKPVPASATGKLNGQCSGLVMGSRQGWPLNGDISIKRDAAGNLEFGLTTEKRGQQMTARGAYGPKFTATGSAGGGAATMQMTVQGELAEDPSQRAVLHGSGTGATAGGGDMQVQCKFSWKTDS